MHHRPLMMHCDALKKIKQNRLTIFGRYWSSEGPNIFLGYSLLGCENYVWMSHGYVDRVTDEI